MSQENVKIVRGMWESFLALDLEAALNAFDPDVEWDGTNLPDGRIGRGHEAIVDHASRWAEQWQGWTVEIEEVLDAGGDQVVVIMREKGRSESGLTMNERHGELYRLRGGKIVWRKGFSDSSEALEAAGLSE